MSLRVSASECECMIIQWVVKQQQVTLAQTKTKTFTLNVDKLPQKASMNIDASRLSCADSKGASWTVGGGGLGYKGRSPANDTTF